MIKLSILSTNRAQGTCVKAPKVILTKIDVVCFDFSTQYLPTRFCPHCTKWTFTGEWVSLTLSLATSRGLIMEGSALSSKPCLFLHDLLIWPPCGTVLTGGMEGSTLSSKPCLLFHDLLIWPPRGTVLACGTEHSALSSKPCLFLRDLLIWPPRGTVLACGIECSALSSKPCLFHHKLSTWPPCDAVLTSGIEHSVLSSKAYFFLTNVNLTTVWYCVDWWDSSALSYMPCLFQVFDPTTM